jgi:DNA recombination protein RmuC
VTNYNKFVTSFEERLVKTGKKFEDLNLEPSSKKLEDLPAVEALARYSDVALPSPIADEDDALA